MKDCGRRNDRINNSPQNIAYQKKMKKEWIKPELKIVPVSFECTSYAGAK